MSRSVDYYFSLASPWAYLGHAPFMEIAARHGLEVNFKPVFLGDVFEQTGGLPLARRHPARQRYRLMELQRWREKRGQSFVIEPRHVPFNPSLADRFVIAAITVGGDVDGLLRACFAGVWEREQNLADAATLVSIADAAGLDGSRLAEIAAGAAAEAIYALNVENAVEAGVFGSPAYVVDGEIFWGQDRLDLLDDMLMSGRAPYSAQTA